MTADDIFDVYRTEPEAVYSIPGEPPLTISIAALGGGRVGRSYPSNTWIYAVHLDGQLAASGADLHSGAIGGTHQEMAAVLANVLTDDDVPGQTERLSLWAYEVENPEQEEGDRGEMTNQPKHVASPGHEPGTLPDCPACDILLAQKAYEQVISGEICAADANLMLEQRGKRLVGHALSAYQTARNSKISTRDALHLEAAPDDDKEIIASWICPEHADDWRGSREHRLDALTNSAIRAQERREDEALRAAERLSPTDHSLEARHTREVAASIRDHRAAAHRRKAWLAADEESAYLTEARQHFRDREKARVLGDHTREGQANALGNAAVERSIEARHLAEDHEIQSRMYLDANRRYEASETYRVDQQLRGRDREQGGRHYDDHEGER